MLLTELLDHDLHRSRGGTPIPLMIEVPVPKDCFPAVVSGTRGKFLISRGPRESGLAGVGVFDFDSEKLDSLLGPMISTALTLSVGSSYRTLEKFTRRLRGKDVVKSVPKAVPGSYENVFVGPSAADAAFDFLRKSSGLKAQPHVCLVPSSWDEKRVSSFFGKDYAPSERRFRECCRVIPHDVPIPTFFSRPDMVGMYTQFMGGGAAILLHNVGLGMAFCPQKA